jgi:hypothetical protein
MTRIGFAFVVLVMFSCNNHKNDKDENGFSYEAFSKLFHSSAVPYRLSDADLLSNKDTSQIRSPQFLSFIPDSLKTALFGKTTRVRYVALANVKGSGHTSYYVVKAIGGNKRVALLMPFTDNKSDAVFPFLVPDADPSTSQQSILDRQNAVIKNITQRQPSGVTAEGSEVYQYDVSSKRFLLALTNPIGNGTSEIVNPIDTLPRKHKFSGDYVKNKRNFVSVRDGRSANQLLVFVHIENEKGDCTGELKAEVLLTSPTTAIYREGGDPCGMAFRFSTSSVIVKEEGGCGSRRGLDCSFDGSFNRKKEAKSKTQIKKSGK